MIEAHLEMRPAARSLEKALDASPADRAALEAKIRERPRLTARDAALVITRAREIAPSHAVPHASTQSLDRLAHRVRRRTRYRSAPMR